VRDAAGALLYSATPAESRRVLDERVAWLISDILSDDDARRLSFGANSILKLERAAAVKTGTTNDYRDNWTIGYTPELVTGVWVGNASNEAMRDVSGISGAGPIWSHFMRTVLAGRPDRPFLRPPGLVQVEVCSLSGLLPTAACPYRRREWFIAGSQPVEYDTFFKQVVVDSATGRLATVTTPPERRQEVLALDLPPAAGPWARGQGLTLLEELQGDEPSGGEAAAPAAPLYLISPTPRATYRLSPALPPAAQRLRLEAIAAAGLREVTIWLDGAPLPGPAGPPYFAWWELVPGEHQVWAQALDGSGVPVASDLVSFTVLDGD
jgi:membrane carboxypeptidase/penicillin-binding protein PbpC